MPPIPLPDLLHGRERARVDASLLEELLGLAFLGSNETAAIHRSIGESPLAESKWNPDLYADEVFLAEFVAGYADLELEGRRYRAHEEFLTRVLGSPPCDLETIRFRQAIVRELERDDELRSRTEALYRELIYLLDLIKSAHTQRSVDSTPDRMRVLAQCAAVIDAMDGDFAASESGLRRIHEAGQAIKGTRTYRILVDLLAFEDELAAMRVSMRLGADGRIRSLQIDDFEEARDNRFYKRPWARWRDMLGLFWRGYAFSSREVANRVIVDVYLKIAPELARISLLAGHLEVYLAARGFADAARSRGLDVILPEVVEEGELRYERLFNPLLLNQRTPPVPCTLQIARPSIDRCRHRSQVRAARRACCRASGWPRSSPRTVCMPPRRAPRYPSCTGSSPRWCRATRPTSWRAGWERNCCGSGRCSRTSGRDPWCCWTSCVPARTRPRPPRSC